MMTENVFIELILASEFVSKFESEEYSEAFYHTLCNKEFQRDGELFSFTMRTLGYIVSEIRNELLNTTEDYLTWYAHAFDIEESFLEDEIILDLKSLHINLVSETLYGLE